MSSHQLDNPKSILVRMPNWLGDFVMATPILRELKQKWPDSKITAMCQGGLGELLKHDPFVSEVFTFKKPKGWFNDRNKLEQLQKLQRNSYDLGILTTNSYSSAWWLWKGKVKQKVGYKGNLRSLLLDRAIVPSNDYKEKHLVFFYKKLLDSIGITSDGIGPHLVVSEEESREINQLLSSYSVCEDSILVGINPSAAYGPAKCWLPSRFRETVVRLLQNPRVSVIFVGDKSGMPLINELCEGFDERVINLAGMTSIRELLALIKRFDVFLTNDSGPMHVADALGTPLIALFGSTSDVRTGPFSGGHVIHKRVDCSPCYHRKCPVDFRCMRQISVDEVYKNLHSLLQGCLEVARV